MYLRDRIVRQRAPLVDGPYGNRTRDWSAVSAAEYPAAVQPVSSTEDVVDQQRTITRWRLYLYPQADLQATDRVVWDGQTFEVEGDVERWKRGAGLHHLRAVLVRVEQGAR